MDYSGIEFFLEISFRHFPLMPVVIKSFAKNTKCPLRPLAHYNLELHTFLTLPFTENHYLAEIITTGDQ